MVNLSQSLRREIAAMPPGSPCCATWELQAIALTVRHAARKPLQSAGLLAGRLRTLARLGPAQAESGTQEPPSPEVVLSQLPLAGAPATAKRLRRCCRGAILRGAVWRGAYLNSGGHLEFCSASPAVVELLRRTRVPFLEASRRTSHVLYLKDQETIAEVTGLMGAFETMLALEDVLVTKRMRNDINRVVNCEVGNLSRIGRSAASLMEAIQILRRAGMFESLPPRLQDVAQLRSRHPDASIVELARRSKPPLSKSGMQHRLEELAQLAAVIRRKRKAK
jgi:hypothetical protein